jgi:hypothetical protein
MAAILTPIPLRLLDVPMRRSSLKLLMTLSILLICFNGASRGAEPLETLALSPDVYAY